MNNSTKRGINGAIIFAVIFFLINALADAIHEPDVNEIEIKVLEYSE